MSAEDRGVVPVPVLHVITRMVRGGAQENTLASVADMDAAAWRSALVTGPADGPEGSLEPECSARGIRLIHEPSLLRELSPLRDFAAYGSLVRLIRREAPLLVHTHTSKAGILGRRAARTARVPAVVHTPHGHVFHGYAGGAKTRLFIAAERAAAKLADRLIALTQREMEEHLELGIGRPAQWRVVHSGVDLSRFIDREDHRPRVRAELGLEPGDVVLGTVGRLVEIKGHCHLLHAFQQLVETASMRPRGEGRLRLVLVGDGPLQAPLAEQARGLGLSIRTPEGGRGDASVIFAGLRRDVPDLLSAFDLFVLPSLNEGMGRVLVEAMAAELPCVASRVSGIPDVVAEGETGLLVPPADATALAAAMAELLADRDGAARMGMRGRVRAEAGFGLPSMLQGLDALYREVLLEKGIQTAASQPGST